MNRRSFLTFIGLGAIGAATCIEPPGPMIDPEMAVALPEDIQRIPAMMEPYKAPSLEVMRLMNEVAVAPDYPGFFYK